MDDQRQYGTGYDHPKDHFKVAGIEILRGLRQLLDMGIAKLSNPHGPAVKVPAEPR